MPAKLERQLKRKAKSKGLKDKRASAYVYGALRKTGWTPSTQRNTAIKLNLDPCYPGILYRMLNSMDKDIVTYWGLIQNETSPPTLYYKPKLQ